MNLNDLSQVAKISKYFLSKRFIEFEFNESSNLIIFYGGKIKKKAFYCDKDIFSAVADAVL